MPNALGFLDTIANFAGTRSNGSADRPVRLGTIDPAYVSASYPGTMPKVTFDGESTLSGKRYVVVGSYRPTAGDRVALVPIGLTYAIIGAVDTDSSTYTGGTSKTVGNADFLGGVDVTGYLGVTGDCGITGSATVAGITVPRGVVGGNYYTGSARTIGVVDTEALANVTSGSLALLASRLYLITVKIKVAGTVAGDDYVFRVRDTDLNGAQLGEFPWHNPNSGLGWTLPAFSFRYVPSVDASKTFVLTAQRLAGSGSVSVETGGAGNPSFMAVVDVGGSSALTLVS